MFQTFQTEGIGFEVWSWGALCIKWHGDPGHKLALVTIWVMTPPSLDGLSYVGTLVACVLWFGPFEGHTLKGQQTEMNHHMMWRIKGNFCLFLRDKEIWGPTEKPCAHAVMVSSEWKVNLLTLQRWERQGTKATVNTAGLCVAPTRVGVHSEGLKFN